MAKKLVAHGYVQGGRTVIPNHWLRAHRNFFAVIVWNCVEIYLFCNITRLSLTFLLCVHRHLTRRISSVLYGWLPSRLRTYLNPEMLKPGETLTNNNGSKWNSHYHNVDFKIMIMWTAHTLHAILFPNIDKINQAMDAWIKITMC